MNGRLFNFAPFKQSLVSTLGLILVLLPVFAFVGFTAFAPVRVDAYTSPGRPQGYVSDFADILQPSTRAALNAKLQEVAKTNGAEIAIVTIPELKDETVETYAVKLFEEWGIGKKGQDNGLLLLISFLDQKIRIEVGYGLEGTITDVKAWRIITEDLKPAFKEHNYDFGVLSATADIVETITGEAGALSAELEQNTPAPKQDPSAIDPETNPIAAWIVTVGQILLFVFIVGLFIYNPRLFLWLLFDLILNSRSGGRGGSSRGSSGGGFGGGRSGGGGASGGW